MRWSWGAGRTARATGITVLATTLLVTAARLEGVEWYVNNVKGDDARDGRSEEVSGSSGPFRTIARALRSAEAGDRILLANTGKPYQESITLQGGSHSGTRSSPFALIGNGAVLDGRKPVPAGAWEFYEGHVFRFRPERMAFQVLYLDDTPATRVDADPTRETLPPLQPRQWCLWRGHIYFCVEPRHLPSDYDISYGGDTVGITLYEVRHVVVMDLTVRGFQLDGINAHDGARDVILAGVTSRGNGRSGFSVGGASRVMLWQCVGTENGAAQLRMEGYSRTTIKQCRFDPGPGVATVREDHAVMESPGP